MSRRATPARRPARRRPAAPRARRRRPRNDTGPRFETITTGRSATPEPYAAMLRRAHDGIADGATCAMRRGARQVQGAPPPRAEVAAAIARAPRPRLGATCDEAPMADGGEGTLDALGGANRTTTVTGPLGDPVEAPWRFAQDRAVIEMAAASGLDAGRRRRAATTRSRPRPTAPASSSRWPSRAARDRVIVGVGGSATTDGGLGALRALYPPRALSRRRAGRGLRRAHHVRRRRRGVRAAEGRDRRPRSSCCAAGSSAWPASTSTTTASTCASSKGRARPAAWPAGWPRSAPTLQSGFDVVADEVELYDRIEGADLVITGEGFLDAESFDGKVVGGVCDWPPRSACRCSPWSVRRSTTSISASRRSRSSSASARTGR